MLYACLKSNATKVHDHCIVAELVNTCSKTVYSCLYQPGLRERQVEISVLLPHSNVSNGTSMGEIEQQ